MNVVENSTFTQVDLYEQLLETQPKILASTQPDNAARQRELFLMGDIENPDHTHARLDEIDARDFDAVTQLGEALRVILKNDPKYRSVYDEFTETYSQKLHLLQLMAQYNASQNESDKAAIREQYMQLNVELYGAPDEATYRTLLAEKMEKIDAKNLSGREKEMRDELHNLLPSLDVEESTERFKPSQATIEWAHNVATTLYEGMVAHIPDQDKFTDEEIKSVFQEILAVEFGDSAAGWEVVITDDTRISVSAADKQIAVPKGVELTKKQLTLRTVHEIGVHVLRSITGEDTTLLPLRLGLSEYYDAEEGTGMVMEQAWQGIFKEMGLKHYITTGLVHFDKRDFRQAFEINWRINTLMKSSAEGGISDEDINKERDSAYTDTFRILRGTDELPLFKDLAYYNGSIDIWKFLESIRGDDFRFTLFMMGKVNTSQKHLRTILGAKPVV